MTSAVGLIVGAAIAGVFSFVGILYGSWRSRSQWLMETRRAAYAALMTGLSQYQVSDPLERLALVSGAPPADVVRERRAMTDALLAGISAVELAGPRTVSDAA